MQQTGRQGRDGRACTRRQRASCPSGTVSEAREARGVRPFHDVDGDAAQASHDVERVCISGAQAPVTPCDTQVEGTVLARIAESRRRLRGDEAGRRNVEEMRDVELVGTSSTSAVPGIPRTFGCDSIAMGSGSA